MRSLLRSSALLYLLGCSVPLCAGTINVGVLSFDELIPSGSTPGVNTFTVLDLTQDPGTGGFALPPDFPVFTAVSFLDASLSVTHGSTTDVIALGDIGPGVFSPASLNYSSAVPISSATFSATLSPASWLLFDSSSFTPSSLTVTADLLPSSGDSLAAGIDSALITASDTSSAVPEPTTLSCGILGFLLLGSIRKFHR
jgi:hypothetical protein